MFSETLKPEIRVTVKKSKETGEVKVVLVYLPEPSLLEDEDLKVWDRARVALKERGGYYNPDRKVWSLNPAYRAQVVEICKNAALQAGWTMPGHTS